MQGFSKHLILALLLGLTLFFGEGSQLLRSSPAAAQEGSAAGEVSPAEIERPFQLPFADPPSPDTWLMAQPYGNTTGAYRRRLTTYGASGGIHFGVDLSAPCGTEIVAIADGVVFAIDGPFGSPPHNLMIDHPQLGYASLYGHLLEPPNLVPGQPVEQGQVIAKVGDSAETCYGRPHLHLEIRDLAHIRKYNPLPLIEANWDNLALTGSSGRDFARDLDEPRKWQSLYDQPEVRTGGPIVNDFANPWPPDWEKPVLARTAPLTATELSFPAAGPVTDPDKPGSAAGRYLTAGECCTNLSWNAASTTVRFIDRPTATAPLGLWGIDVTQPESDIKLVTNRLGLYSPDGSLIAYSNPLRGTTVIERLADGQTWEVATQGRRPRFTPDGRQLMWTVYDEDAPRDTRVETVWLADVDGSNARILLRAARTDVIGWLSDDTLLISQRVPGSSDETLLTLRLADGRQTELLTVPEPRGLAFSPDNRYLIYTITFEPDAAQNGIWLLDLEDIEAGPQKLPFFGTYRWRDSERLVYIPFDPAAPEHNFYEYNITTEQNRPLFPAGTNLKVANNDWQISPDGRKIALVAANDNELAGIRVLDLD